MPASDYGSASRCKRRSTGSNAAPTPHNEEGEIEIRQVFEAEDFGPSFTPELRAQEERLRAQIEKYKVS